MTLSTTAKDQMLAVGHLSFSIHVEIKNDSDAWVDFTDRDPEISEVRLSTERLPNKVITSLSSLSLDNADLYFDYMEAPDHATTIATFGTFATAFATGFRGREIRPNVTLRLPDGAYEAIPLGVYKIKNIERDNTSPRVKLSLGPDVDFLRDVGAEDMGDGNTHYLNRPITYLVRKILEKVYPGGVSDANFEIPDRVYLETADGEPAFSHYGKPPEWDPDTDRWRNDIDFKPHALLFHDGFVYVGIGNFVWRFDPATENWDMAGNMTATVRGIYLMSSTRLFVVAYDYDRTSRSQTMKTGFLLMADNSCVTNDPGYNKNIFSGELVIRDVNTDLVTMETCHLGVCENTPSHPSVGLMGYGLNMPVPFPQWPSLGVGTTYGKCFGYGASGLRTLLQTFNAESTVDEAIGQTLIEPGYCGADSSIAISSTVSTIFNAYWGHAPNLSFVEETKNFGGPWLFTVKTDGNPLGIRNTGTCEIVAYYDYRGYNVTVSENPQTADLAPIYGLRHYKDTTYDWLFWIDVDWVETSAYPPYSDLADMDPPSFRINRGLLIDDGAGNPKLFDASIAVLWTGGDDLFATDDNEHGVITVMPFGYGFIVQTIDLADMGGQCFELFFVNGAFASATSLGTSATGWASFTESVEDDRIYFLERDTGRVLYVDTTGTVSAYNVLGDGTEPVAQAFHGAPQASGFGIEVDGSDVYLWGLSFPAVPPFTQESEVALAGKYYLWKYHPELTDRVELFQGDRQGAFDALGLLAQVVNYQIGLDPDGRGFFRAIPESSGSSEFTIDLDSAIERHFKVVKRDGFDEIINRSTFIPYEAVPGLPEANIDLAGYIAPGGSQVYYDGETEVRSNTLIEKNITLHCVKAGAIGTAEFKYLIHDFQISTTLREDINPSDLDQLRLANNKDVAVDMLCQVGTYEGAAGLMHVDAIEADGDIDLSENLDRPYESGTPVIFRSSESGKWSTEHDTPDTFTTSTTFSEIGSTGLFLKFTEGEDENVFAIGDRILIHNPGLALEKSRTKKFMAEDSESIENFGLREYNIDNPYMSLTLGKPRAQAIVADESGPHRLFIAECPFFLQARPLMLVTIKSRKLLPLAPDNEEKCYIKQVSHKGLIKNGNPKTTIIVRGVTAYA